MGEEKFLTAKHCANRFLKFKIRSPRVHLITHPRERGGRILHTGEVASPDGSEGACCAWVVGRVYKSLFASHGVAAAAVSCTSSAGTNIETFSFLYNCVMMTIATIVLLSRRRSSLPKRFVLFSLVIRNLQREGHLSFPHRFRRVDAQCHCGEPNLAMHQRFNTADCLLVATLCLDDTPALCLTNGSVCVEASNGSIHLPGLFRESCAEWPHLSASKSSRGRLRPHPGDTPDPIPPTPSSTTYYCASTRPRTRAPQLLCDSPPAAAPAAVIAGECAPLSSGPSPTALPCSQSR